MISHIENRDARKYVGYSRGMNVLVLYSLYYNKQQVFSRCSGIEIQFDSQLAAFSLCL